MTPRPRVILRTTTPGPPLTREGADALTLGEDNFLRSAISGTAVLTAGALSMAMFTSRKTFTASKVRAAVGAAAAVAATLVRVGIYTLNAANDGTLVASTPSDTALFAVASVLATKDLSVPLAIRAGQRYAIGVLSVGGTQPMLYSQVRNPLTDGMAPRLNGLLTAQADLPASFTGASLATDSVAFYLQMLPVGAP